MCPWTDEWTNKICEYIYEYIYKICYIHIYVYMCIYICGILFSHKKKEILSFATTWMDLEGIMLSEITQMKKDKYYIIS